MTLRPVRALLGALLTVLLLGSLVASAAQARPLVGFADQKPSMFDDSRFKDLGIRQARLNLPWDVLKDPITLANADAWFAGARADKVAPLITIDRSRRRGKAGLNPTTTQIGDALVAWRKRWPGQVKLVSTWNEGNINKKPELVARWYLQLRKRCPTCTVLGADVVDRSNAGSWAKRFIKAAKRQPAVWGLHNYIDANTFSTKSTTAFLKAVKGKVWLTETGGVLKRSKTTVKFKGTGSSHANKATSWVFKKLVPLSSRIQRVYLYSWSTAPNDRSWDSGMIGPDGKQRPALRTVRCYLGSCSSKAPVQGPPVPPAADVVTTPAP